MKEAAELNRVNYANSTHHREAVRRQIDPALIERIEVCKNPSLNYRNAFKNVYQDELERTVEEQREKKNAQMSLHLQPQNSASCLFNRSDITVAPHQQSLSRLKQFADFEDEKTKKYCTLIEKQLNEGHSFFKAQDDYQQRRQRELESTKLLLQQQRQIKEMQKFMGMQQHAKENYELRENRRRQMEQELMEKQESRAAQQGLASEIQSQIEKERIRRQRKSIVQMGGEGRHNPITNPIEYHIQNPYILGKIQQQGKWGGLPN